jgi:PAS domain-containing protein
VTPVRVCKEARPRREAERPGGRHGSGRSIMYGGGRGPGLGRLLARFDFGGVAADRHDSCPSSVVGPVVGRSKGQVMREGVREQQAGSARDKADLEFRRLLDKLPAAAYTCDAEGLITYFNQRAVQTWGREPRLNDPVDRY